MEPVMELVMELALDLELELALALEPGLGLELVLELALPFLPVAQARRNSSVVLQALCPHLLAVSLVLRLLRSLRV